MGTQKNATLVSEVQEQQTYEEYRRKQKAILQVAQQAKCDTDEVCLE